MILVGNFFVLFNNKIILTVNYDLMKLEAK